MLEACCPRCHNPFARRYGTAFIVGEHHPCHVRIRVVPERWEYEITGTCSLQRLWRVREWVSVIQELVHCIHRHG